MRVLHLIDNLNQGGEQRQLLELCRRTDHREVQHLLLTYHWDPFFLEDFRGAGVEVSHIEKGFGFRPAFLWRLRRFVHRHRIDILHGHLDGPCYWAALASTPMRRAALVLQEASVDLDLLPVRALAKAVLYRRADALITNTHLQAEVLQERYRIRRVPVSVIPNGVDLDRYSPTTTARRVAARRALGIPEDAFVAGLSGRVYDVKNPWLLLEAARGLAAGGGAAPEVLHAGLVVDPDLRDRIDAAAAEAGLRWRWLGEESDMPRFYAALDVLALTSVREGLPNVLLEAMASGIPVIATDVGDVPRLLEGGGGVLVPSGDADATAAALARYGAMTAEQRAEVGRAGREIAARYTPEANLAAMMEVYRGVS